MGKTETCRTSTITPFLLVVPAGRQRLIASLYVLETHLDTIKRLVTASPSDNTSQTPLG